MRLLQQITVAVMKQEPVLIVGETGTGKTSTVQYLARRTDNVLKVINMNQQSDSTDLLGGFKPVDLETILLPYRRKFDELFEETWPEKKFKSITGKKNDTFSGQVSKIFYSKNWNKLLDLMNATTVKAKKSLKNKPSKKKLTKEWNKFQEDLKKAKEQVDKSAFAFSFIEGTLVKAVKEGQWVLLDEINLASADALECLSGLLDSIRGSITLHERGDTTHVVRHPNFRLFACMNPATDVGKKELPVGLRNRFTEFYMDELRTEQDLMTLIRDYLAKANIVSKIFLFKIFSFSIIFYFRITPSFPKIFLDFTLKSEECLEKNLLTELDTNLISVCVLCVELCLLRVKSDVIHIKGKFNYF